mgnify:CR=1 FL=1
MDPKLANRLALILHVAQVGLQLGLQVLPLESGPLAIVDDIQNIIQLPLWQGVLRH